MRKIFAARKLKYYWKIIIKQIEPQTFLFTEFFMLISCEIFSLSMKLASLEISMNRLESFDIDLRGLWFWNKNGRKSLAWFYVKSVCWWIDILIYLVEADGMVAAEGWCCMRPSSGSTLIRPEFLPTPPPGVWSSTVRSDSEVRVEKSPGSVPSKAYTLTWSPTPPGVPTFETFLWLGVDVPEDPVPAGYLKVRCLLKTRFVVTHKAAWCFSAISKGIIFCCKKQALQEFL